MRLYIFLYLCDKMFKKHVQNYFSSLFVSTIEWEGVKKYLPRVRRIPSWEFFVPNLSLIGSSSTRARYSCIKLKDAYIFFPFVSFWTTYKIFLRCFSELLSSLWSLRLFGKFLVFDKCLLLNLSHIWLLVKKIVTRLLRSFLFFAVFRHLVIIA